MSGLIFVTMVKARTFLPKAIRIAVARLPSLPAVSIRMESRPPCRATMPAGEISSAGGCYCSCKAVDQPGIN